MGKDTNATAMPPKRVGWKARIGVITPAVLEMIAYDFYRIAPDGVTLVGVTDETNSWSPEDIDRVLKSAMDSAAYLGGRKVDYIVHAGAAHVASRGTGYERTFIAELERRSGVRATTSVRSAIDALKHLNADRVAVAAAWPARIARWVTDVMEADGLRILGVDGADVDYAQLHTIEPQTLIEFAVAASARYPDAQAIYMPGPQAPSVSCIDAIERRTGKPVVASTAADFWAAFRALGLTDRIEGHGVLLQSLSEER